MIIKGNSNSLLHQNTYNPYSVNKADMDFISLVNNKITGYGQIPYQVPRELIIDCIKSAAKLFYEYHPSTLHNRFYVIDTRDIYPDKDGRWYQKPFIIDPKIMVIRKIFDVDNSFLSKDDFNIYETNNVLSGTHINMNNTAGINNNMFMIENAVKMVELSALENMFKPTVAYDYNWHTNELYIKKSFSTHTKLVLDCFVCNNVETLYKNFLFEKYVIALTKRELKRILGAHTIQLAGNATLNVDEICNNLEDIENIEDKLRTMSGIGDIILTR